MFFNFGSIKSHVKWIGKLAESAKLIKIRLSRIYNTSAFVIPTKGSCSRAVFVCLSICLLFAGLSQKYQLNFNKSQHAGSCGGSLKLINFETDSALKKVPSGRHFQ